MANLDGWTDLGYTEDDGTLDMGPHSRRKSPSEDSDGPRFTISAEIDGEPVDLSEPFYWAPEFGQVSLRRPSGR